MLALDLCQKVNLSVGGFLSANAFRHTKVCIQSLSYLGGIKHRH